MIRVAYLPMLADDPACFYRMTGVLSRIVHPDIHIKNILHDGTYSWAVLSEFDILLLQRPSCEAHISLIKLAKDMNIRVISDFDDDLFNVPVHENDNMTLDEQKKNIKMCLSLSDEVWVTTPAIRKIYKPFNRNIHIIPNAHDNYRFPVNKKRAFNPTKLAVYRGGASHLPDLYQDINDIVSTIGDNKDWEFRFVGSRFKFIEDRTGNNHTYTKPSTLMQFFSIYNDCNAPLAFFPLVTNQFNAGKSNICLMESTYAGGCFLGNKELPEFNLPFVTDISKGLYEPFKELKDDFDSMKTLNSQAWDWVCEHRLLSNINKQRIERICNQD